MFSQTTEYALRAMSCLALRPTDLVSTPTLAGETKVPANYLAKVLQQLAAARLITGRRGVGGGYKLAKSADEIRLIDVINAVTRVERIKTCPLGIHGNGLCALHRKVDEAAKAVIEVFNGVTLHDLLADSNTSKPLCETKATVAVSVDRRR